MKIKISRSIGVLPADAGNCLAPLHKRENIVTLFGRSRVIAHSCTLQVSRRRVATPIHRHAKAEHRMDRNYLKGRDGDRINAVLAAGYNFSLLLRWLAALLRALFAAFDLAATIPQTA